MQSEDAYFKDMIAMDFDRQLPAPLLGMFFEMLQLDADAYTQRWEKYKRHGRLPRVSEDDLLELRE